VKNILLFFLALSVLISCSALPKKKEKKGEPLQQTLPVTLYKVPPPQDIVFELEYPGKTKSSSEVKVVARVSGVLQKMLFKEGSYVKQGALLYVIEKDIYQAQYEMAKAQLEKAQVELARAERDWKRISEAIKDRLVSEAEKDKALADLENARAKLREAKAQLTQAELNLKYTEIKAEIEGIAGKKLVDPGNLVNPGTVLTTINKISPLEIEFSIPERDFPLLGLKNNPRRLLNQRIDILLGENTFPEKGVITFVDSKLDETSSLKIKALIENKKGGLLPEQFLKIRIKGTPQKALLLPQKVVMEGPKGSFVFMVEEGKVKVRPIKISQPYKDLYIVEEGLKPGEEVIADNLVKLRPGAPVKVEKVVEVLP